MSSYNVKPGVDWNAIKADFDSGANLSECVRRQCARGVKITRHAIEKRRDKEGWDATSALANATKLLPSVIRQEEGRSITRHRTPETAQKVLDSLRTIPNYAAACAHAGISRAALDEWRKEPEFQELCDRALALSAAEDITRIKQAGERDWKAAQYSVERNPVTKADFADKSHHGPNIQVVLNIDRATEDKITIEGKTG